MNKVKDHLINPNQNPRVLIKLNNSIKEKKVANAWKRMEKRLADFNLVTYVRRRLDVMKKEKEALAIDTGETKIVRRLYEKAGVTVEYDETKEGNLLETLTQGGFSNMNVSAEKLVG